jgi:hypothetical protein
LLPNLIIILICGYQLSIFFERINSENSDSGNIHADFKAWHTSLIEVFNGLNSIPIAFLILVLSNLLVTEAAFADTLSMDGAL